MELKRYDGVLDVLDYIIKIKDENISLFLFSIIKELISKKQIDYADRVLKKISRNKEYEQLFIPFSKVIEYIVEEIIKLAD